MTKKWLIILISIVIPTAVLIAGCGLVADSPEDGDSDPSGGSGGDQTGTIILSAETVPSGQVGAFTFTGVPTGTMTTDGTLVVSNLEPGTYTTTEVDPAPDFDLTSVVCDDGDSPTTSSGDAQTRTAVINLDPGETVQCIFTNAQRGSLVVASRGIPDGTAGQVQFTGVPSGTIPINGTLVVANLTPGTYTSTQVDPAPQFDLGAVECDDGSSPSVSSGDPTTRSANFNLDPGEMVTCTFVNIRRGTAVIIGRAVPEDAVGTFQYTGVPSGTVSSNGTLVVADLPPGTYTSTQVDPEPDFELKEVYCDDGGSDTESSGDAQTRSAIFNIDPGETVTCTFANVEPGAVYTPTGVIVGGITDGDGDGTEGDGDSNGGRNPFDDPEVDLDDFPVPEDVPEDAGTFNAPKPGPWTVTHFAGLMACGEFELDIPASPSESGVLEVLDEGKTVIGTGLETAQGVSITMEAAPEITGRYTGSFDGVEQGVPVTIDYFWQVVTDEHIIGYLTSSLTSEGVTCSIYRSFEMFYTGD